MNKVFTLVLYTSLTLSLLGCQMNNGSGSQQGQTGQTQSLREQTAQIRAQVNSANQDALSRADHLVTLANTVPNVQGSRAFVTGRLAIVAIDIDKEVDRSKAGTIKYTVAEALKKDPLGATAIVTADPDVRQRITEMYEQAKAGRPISGFAAELADITARLIPQIPQNVVDKPNTP